MQEVPKQAEDAAPAKDEHNEQEGVHSDSAVFGGRSVVPHVADIVADARIIFHTCSPPFCSFAADEDSAMQNLEDDLEAEMREFAEEEEAANAAAGKAACLVEDWTSERLLVTVCRVQGKG